MSDLIQRILVAIMLVAAVAMLADLSTAPRSKFTAANYERLEIGMTLDDAIAILGEPNGIDRSLQDMAWVTWYSPFDEESSMTGIFVYPGETLGSKERRGHLPDRPLLVPDVLPDEPEKPSFIVMLEKHKQAQERRTMLMLDP